MLLWFQQRTIISHMNVCVCRNVRPGSTDCRFRRAVWRPGRALAAAFGVNAMATVTHVILKHPSVRYTHGSSASLTDK